MDNQPDSSQRSRENVLATSLVLLGGGMMLFFLYIISLGIVGNVLGIGIGFIMLALPGLGAFLLGRGGLRT
jgi:hypothetical protein